MAHFTSSGDICTTWHVLLRRACMQTQQSAAGFYWYNYLLHWGANRSLTGAHLQQGSLQREQRPPASRLCGFHDERSRSAFRRRLVQSCDADPAFGEADLQQPHACRNAYAARQRCQISTYVLVVSKAQHSKLQARATMPGCCEANWTVELLLRLHCMMTQHLPIGKNLICRCWQRLIAVCASRWCLFAQDAAAVSQGIWPGLILQQTCTKCVTAALSVV